MHQLDKIKRLDSMKMHGAAIKIIGRQYSSGSQRNTIETVEDLFCLMGTEYRGFSIGYMGSSIGYMGSSIGYMGSSIANCFEHWYRVHGAQYS